jgi:intein-encoded DNA endonuclease-like protein
MPKISSESKSHIITLYNSGNKNLAQISRELNISRPTVRKILRQAGLRQVYKEDIDNSDTINTEFFKCIDSEEKAYFLGLMYADGNVYIQSKTRTYYSISLCLQERDKAILEKFKKKIAPNHKLYFVKKQDGQQNQYKLLFNSKIVSEQLFELGCMPAKSLKLEFPSLPNSTLQRHFIRGYFDGDGCISSSKRKNGYEAYSASIASTKDFCLAASSVINNELDIKPTIYTRKSNGITSELSFGGNHQVVKFMEWLYKDSTIRIVRKYSKFEKLKKSLTQYAKKNGPDKQAPF